MNSLALATRLGVRTLLQGSRQYATKISRRPLRIVTPEEAARPRRIRAVVEEPHVPESHSTNVVKEEKDLDSEPALEGKPSVLPPGFPPFEKAGTDDTILSRFALDTSCSSKRSKSGMIMLEGKNLIQDALDANIKLKALFFSRVKDVVSLHLPSHNLVFQKVVYKKIQRWSKLTTSPGLIGFFEIPKENKIKTRSALPFSIVCDNIREPGNLGSILRVAASAGCRTVFLSKGCVDLWNDKVLRSAMGAHFHVCIKEHLEWKDIEEQLEPNSYIMFADNKDIELDSSEESAQDNVSDESDQKINEDASSPADQDSNCNEKVSETSWQKLPAFPYYLVNYSAMGNMYLVIGGESGFSTNAETLGNSHKKFRVNIPMLNSIESLNVGTALAILTHEIKRQFEIGVKSDEHIRSTNTVPMTDV